MDQEEYYEWAEAEAKRYAAMGMPGRARRLRDRVRALKRRDQLVAEGKTIIDVLNDEDGEEADAEYI